MARCAHEHVTTLPFFSVGGLLYRVSMMLSSYHYGHPLLICSSYGRIPCEKFLARCGWQGHRVATEITTFRPAQEHGEVPRDCVRAKFAN